MTNNFCAETLAATARVFSCLAATKVMIFVVAGLFLGGCSQDAVDLESPQAVYNNYCFACHDTGAAGAPPLGTAFWQEASKHKERLYENTLKGIRAMPRKGTCLSCTDEQLKRTVDWMLAQ